MTKARSSLRPIDKKRLDGLEKNHDIEPDYKDTWFIHTVLAQCFLPYRNPKTRDWFRKNGDFSIALTAGKIEAPETEQGYRVLGLPYGTKPRLFQSYICTQAVKNQSPVIEVERSMTAMMKELGLHVSGGKEGSINKFKEQTVRFAACQFSLVGPGPRGTRRHINAPPVKSCDIWFPANPEQESIWPSEITLTDDYYYSLKDHAIPYDYRGLKIIQSNARAQDIYLWMTQRLCRIPKDKPLFMTWNMLYEMFGGGIASERNFHSHFRKALLAARTAYPDSRLEELEKGIHFYASPPPIPKVKITVQKPCE